jgi:hypothetical protein
MNIMQQERRAGAAAANAEDSSLWRWFSELLDERRIKWHPLSGRSMH